MKRALQLIEAALAAGFVAVLCFAGYAAWNGMLTPERIESAGRALREQEAPTHAPAETPKDLAARYADEALVEKQRAVEALRTQETALALSVNERRAELARLEGEAARARKDIADRSDAVARAEQALAESRAAQEKLVKSAAFRKQVETFESMKERDAARHLYAFENPLAVELLRAFHADFRAGVIEEIERIDRLSENASREPKAPALLRLMWPGESANAQAGARQGAP